eukprot:COSAG04_NODE_11553_length_702_cov_1.807629_1_plen_48_part_10
MPRRLHHTSIAGTTSRRALTPTALASRRYHHLRWAAHAMVELVFHGIV